MTGSTTKKFYAYEELIEAAAETFELAVQQDVRLALLGGLAMQIYGSDRLTGDVDFVAEDDPGFPRLRELSFGGYATESSTGVPVDIIVRADDDLPLYEAALDNAVLHEQTGIRVVAPAFLAVIKFSAQRGKDLLDLQTLILTDGFTPGLTASIVKKYLGHFAAREFNNFVAETQWKASRGML